GVQRAFWQNSGKIVVGTFHQHIDKRRAVQAAKPALKCANQMRMRKLCSSAQARQSCLGIAFVHLDQLNRSSLRLLVCEFGQKNRAVIGAPQPLAKRKLPLDHQSFPRFPRIGFTHLLLTCDPTFYAISEPLVASTLKSQVQFLPLSSYRLL